MFEVINVNLHFAARHILRDASFRVEDGERCAIVGPNGAGKSTLIKIVAGILKPETGNVSTGKGNEIGYLPQELTLDTPNTVEEECRTVFKEALAYEAEMRELEHRMTEITDHHGPEYEKIAERYDYLLHETMRRDVHSMDSHIAKVLAGLGFGPADLQKRCRDFSGGWQMRIALGKLLLRNPDILLLDEPTNHLDIETIEWLGDWLLQHEGSILMVSHERAFMDKLVNKTIALERGRAVIYRGNYSESLAKRDEMREMQRRAYENQQQAISHVQAFIDRFRYQASKAALVQSRVKQLEKLEMIEPPEDAEGTIAFKFPSAPRCGKEVVAVEKVDKAFGRNHVLDHVDFTLYRGEKVALVGVNGAGKSTFMKLLAGKLKPDSGKLALGSNVSLEYFAQYDYEDLHPANTVLGEFQSSAPLSVSDRSRDILGAFLFRGDDVQKSIAMLSGGEKTRLRLAKMLCGSSNLLLLDEPTNHLDIGSRLTLENALRQYDGAVVIVSHDRYFLDNVATRVVEVRDGQLHDYPGDFETYLSLKALQEEGKAQKVSSGPALSVPNSNGSAAQMEAPKRELSAEEKRLRRNERNDLQKQLKKISKELQELEENQTRLEQRRRDLETEMADPAVATDAPKLAGLTAELEQIRSDLEKTEERWVTAQVEAEELEDAVASLA
ncbi:MAG: ABC-F family ATP-binding cassette domain-containing protein [Sumerlaeia bacterium]